MKKLTEREIALLIFLGVFVLLAAFSQFALMPALDQRNTLDSEISALEAEKQEYELLMLQKDANEAKLAELKRDKAAAALDLYPYMQSQEVDRLITNIVLRMGLDAKDLTMQHATEPSVIQPYAPSGIAAAETAQLYVSNVQLRVVGAEETAWRLIDLFTNDSPSIRVTGFSLSRAAAAAVEEAAQGGVTLQLSLAVYMYGE